MKCTFQQKILLVVIFLSVILFPIIGQTIKPPSITIKKINLHSHKTEVFVSIDIFKSQHGTITQEDLNVYVNKHLVSDIHISPKPQAYGTESSKLLIMWDYSKSISDNSYQNGKKILEQLVEKLPSDYSLSLIGLGDGVEELTEFTHNRATLLDAISKIEKTGNRTLLNEAIFSWADQLKDLESGPKGILLFTDGIDDGSYIRENDCVQQLATADLPVIAVDLGEKSGLGTNYLKRLARVSRGLYFHPQSSQNFDFNNIVAALKTQNITDFVIRFPHLFLNQTGPYELEIDFINKANQEVIAKAVQHVWINAPQVSATLPVKSWKTFSLANPLFLLLFLLFLVVGFILGFIFLKKRYDSHQQGSIPLIPEPMPGQLGDLRHLAKNLQQEAQSLEKSLLDYGDDREEKIRRWRAVSFEVAKRAVNVLKSCWIERDEPLGQMIYDELVSSLRPMGVEEICPKLGEVIEASDHKFHIRSKNGEPPYKVTQVIYPGYYFRPRLSAVRDPKDETLLEPAHLEVEGV